MPVTAKLSEAFYDRLGHPVADEVADWFNQMDASSRNELREINALNFARFDAKVVQLRWMIGMWLVVLVAAMGLWIKR